MGSPLPGPPSVPRTAYMRLRQWSIEAQSTVSIVEDKAKHIWQNGWTGRLIIAVFIYLVVHWMCHVPPTGEGVLAIALLAAIMTTREMGHTEKAVLIFLLVSLFVVEIRAIGKDRNDTARQQKQDRQEEAQRFQNLLSSEKQSFSDLFTRLIDHEDSNMKQIVKEQRSDFRSIVAQASKARKEEADQFESVIDQQKAMLQHQEELYEFAAGKLLPGYDPIPTICDPLHENEFLVMIGNELGFTTNTFPFTAVHRRNLTINLEKSPDGSILIAVDMRKSDGTIIAEIDKNSSVVNSFLGILQRRDKNSLTLMDQRGAEILSARYLIDVRII